MDSLDLFRNMQIDSNGTREENIAGVEKILGESSLWNGVVVGQETESFFIL